VSVRLEPRTSRANLAPARDAPESPLNKVSINPDEFDATWFTGRLSLSPSPVKSSDWNSSNDGSSGSDRGDGRRGSGEDTIPRAMHQRVMELAAAKAAGENLSRGSRSEGADGAAISSTQAASAAAEAGAAPSGSGQHSVAALHGKASLSSKKHPQGSRETHPTAGDKPKPSVVCRILAIDSKNFITCVLGN
jgi:hypothetical protein